MKESGKASTLPTLPGEQLASPPRRLALVVPSLSGGGAERVVQRLAAGFVNAGHAVTVITTTSRPDFYELPSECERILVDVTGRPAGNALAFSSVWRVPIGLWKLRRALRATNADFIISFMEHVNVLCALLVGGSTRVVATEHINGSELAPGVVWRLLRRAAYLRLERLISVSEGVDSCFAWLSEFRRSVILNPIDDHSPSSQLPSGANSPYLVAMGRLTNQKGFDLLIEAFAAIEHKHPTWNLLILGEGENREALQAQIDEYRLTDRIAMPGRTEDPFPLITAAEAFVLSSRAEGFPMVLIEALACGTPVVSFDCPSGPSEVVATGSNGILVPHLRTDLLADAMDQIMGDTEGRRAYAAQAEASVDHLRLSRIIDQWERDVFDLAEDPVLAR